MTKIVESDVENFLIELLEKEGYEYLSPEDLEEERGDLSQILLIDRLRESVSRLNSDIPEDIQEQTVKKVINLESTNLIEANEELHLMLTEGIDIEYQKNGETKTSNVKIVDFEDISNNDLVVTNQFSVVENEKTKRPDVILLVNGLPLVVIELKNPTDENATVKKAFTQLQNYKNAIPGLFNYNSLLVASDGFDAKAGSLTAGWSRFMAWKTVDGIKEDPRSTPQVKTLVKGMLRPDVLFDLIKHFTVFEKESSLDKDSGLTKVETVKKIAAYHQYHVVNKAIETTKDAVLQKGRGKAGVVWHTQGSGKSLSMVFYSGKIVLDEFFKNPTIVVITDRNDLDDQLFETFSGSMQLLRQEPKQATSIKNLKKLLKTSGGGIIFSTIQKFSTDVEELDFDLLSERDNIVVIADEAHRSHYGFNARVISKGGSAVTRYGFAKYLNDAIPNATFIGFTGTPIESGDISTPAIFGDYIDIYDIEQAVKDGSTVRIYFESRLAKIYLNEEVKEKLDAGVEEVLESEELSDAEKAKAKWAQLEAVVGDEKRMKDIAADFIKHYEERSQTIKGKAFYVAMSRRIAVEMYDQIIKLRPGWEDEDLMKGKIKVIMTSGSSDPESWQKHNTNKTDRKKLANRFKDPNDPLEIVIVRDMWLTGFDAPCLKTMYIDKPIKSHNLMQTIARVNRVYKDIDGGLIVDYIGIAHDLKKALATYTKSGGKGKPTLDQAEAVALMLEKYEVVAQMLEGFDYKEYFEADTGEKLKVILEAEEFILDLEDGKSRFMKEVEILSKAFALAVPHEEALAIKDDVGLFQAIKARLVKFESPGSGKTEEDINTAIRQLVNEAIVSDGVIDIFDAAGIKKPDISILDDEFLAEVRAMKTKNLAVELLKKLLQDEIKTRTKKNYIQSRKISEILDKSIKKYQNNIITAAEVIEELISIANDIKESDKRGEEMGLSDYELAFYDALANNKSALDVLGNDQLKELAAVLVDKVKSNASIDWTIKESVRAKLRVLVKRTLRQYGYPPDLQKLATENVLKQAELLSEEWSGEQQ